jgi:hypothetical protein
MRLWTGLSFFAWFLLCMSDFTMAFNSNDSIIIISQNFCFWCVGRYVGRLQVRIYFFFIETEMQKYSVLVTVVALAGETVNVLNLMLASYRPFLPWPTGEGNRLLQSTVGLSFSSSLNLVLGSWWCLRFFHLLEFTASWISHWVHATKWTSPIFSAKLSAP